MTAAVRPAIRIAALWVSISAIFSATAFAQGDEEPDSVHRLVAEMAPGQFVPESSLGDETVAVVDMEISVRGGTLCFDLAWDWPLDPSAAHVHELGEPDPVIDLLGRGSESAAAPDERGSASGCVEPGLDVVEFLANEWPEFFVDLHTDDYPDGAVGGGLSKVSLDLGDDPEEPDSEPESFVLAAELAPELVIPNPPSTEGFGEVTLDVTPDHDALYVEASWHMPDQTVRSVHLHSGDADEVGEALGGDILVEQGDLLPDALFGSIQLLGALDVSALIDDPESFYVDVHTDEHPDGALRGQLRFVGTADEVYGVDGPDEDDGRSFSSVTVQIAATLLLAAVALGGGRALLRARGLYDDPRPGAAAFVGAAFTLLAATATLMWVQWAVVGDERIEGDAGFAPAAAIVILGAAAAGSASVGARMAQRHPPLRRVGVSLSIVAPPIVLLWLLWWNVLVESVHF